MKLLYIDPVEKGYRNFSRLDSYFKRMGYDTLLLHTTSFFEPVNRKEYKIDNLLLRDISFYQTKLIQKAIEIEKPDIIIIINLSFVFDRAIVNIAKKNNIKIVYLAHGTLINPNSYNKNSNELNAAIRGNPLRIFSRRNYLSLINYLDSQYKQSQFVALVKLIRGVLRSPAQYLTFAKFEEELDVDLNLVYIQDDLEHLVDNMHFPQHKIKVVGNPEISEFIRNEDISRELFLPKIRLDTRDKYILYLDDGLADSEKIWTKKQWYSHLSKIADFLGESTLKLVLKLHPRISLAEHSDFFAHQQNITVVEDCDFKNLICHSEFIISHYSSTILYGFLFHKNIICPRWDDSAQFDFKYDNSLVYYCNTFDAFKDLVVDGFTENKHDAVNAFLNSSGIDVNVDSAKLIADEIVKLNDH